MQNIFIEKPYEFVPAVKSRWQQRLICRLGLHRWLLRRREGVVNIECRNLGRLQESISAGHGILLTPNHPRMADPGVMTEIAHRSGSAFFTMASWHLFNQGRMTRRAIRLLGGFSVNREGMDRQAIDYAIKILQTAERPLLIFPEGTTSRTNDQLMSLMDGPSFIARTAAKRKAKMDGGKVVVHPIAIKYIFDGDIEETCRNALRDLEQKLSWAPQNDLPLVDRLIKVGDALLKIKELEYGCPVPENTLLRQRQTNLVNHLLQPLEKEWLGSPKEGGVQIRIKNLRVKIFPEISQNEIKSTERKRRWEHLERTYLAQQIDCYPDRYVTEYPSVDRILETVEKFEEDYVGKCCIHGSLSAIVNVGEAIEVSGSRKKGLDHDPLMAEIRSNIETMLKDMQGESKMYAPNNC